MDSNVKIPTRQEPQYCAQMTLSGELRCEQRCDSPRHEITRTSGYRVRNDDAPKKWPLAQPESPPAAIRGFSN